MAVVYDKALKRKDAADMATAKKHQKGRKEKDPMKQEKAGIGKVRNGPPRVISSTKRRLFSRLYN